MATWNEMRLRQAEGALRLDAEFWQPQFVQNDLFLRVLPHVRLEDLCTSIRKGIFYILAEDYVEEGVPFYRSANVGDILPRETDLVYITERRDELEYKTSLRRGDIVLAKTARIGACLVMRDRINISQDVIGLRVNATLVNPAYLAVFLASEPGVLQMRRWFQGQVQGHLSLPDVRNLLIPLAPEKTQSTIEKLVLDAATLRDSSLVAMRNASNVLRHAIGLVDHKVSASASYSATLSEARVSNRLDAEYFQPRFREVAQILRSSGTVVGDFTTLRRVKFDKDIAAGNFSYVEIGGVRPEGLVDAEVVNVEDAPSRAQWIVESGDVISSTVRPKRQLTAVIRPAQQGFVCSSGFAVLQPLRVSAEVLVTFLRLPEVCDLLDLATTASMYPALRSNDFLSLPMPRVPIETAEEVQAAVQSGWRLLDESNSHLEEARRVLTRSLSASIQ